VGDLERLWNGARHSVLVFAYAPDLPKDIEDHVREVADNVEQTELGVSRIDDLISIRILSTETWQAHEAIYKCWQALRPSIAGKDARPIMKC
jgi:urease accessory protein UreH